MRKKKSSADAPVPPEESSSDLVIYFGAAIPNSLKPGAHAPETSDDSDPRVPDDPALAWLHDLVGLWRRVPGCTRVFGTESSPVTELDGCVPEDLGYWNSRSLLSLDWISVPGLSSSWSVSAIDLGPAARLYGEWRGSLGFCLLAYSDDSDLERSDRELLRALFESNGGEFGTVVSYGAPTAAQCDPSLPRAFVVELVSACLGQVDWFDEEPDDLEAVARRIVG